MKIKHDKLYNCWYVCRKECLSIGKLSWVIVETFQTKASAQYYIKNLEISLDPSQTM